MSQGASYYEAWWSNLMPLLWDELDQEKVALSRPTTFNTIKLLKEKPDLSFFDIQTTTKKETATDVIRQAFTFGVEDIQDWITEHTDTLATDSVQTIPYWSAYKGSYLTHLLRLEPLSLPVHTGGGRDIVNAHSRTHGPSWRMVVSLEKDGVKAWATYPGGQSGDPGSMHYKDLVGHWLRGEYFLLNFPSTPEEVPAKGYSITLNPAR
jgi:penicillin amidase